MAYADDVDFISHTPRSDINDIAAHLSKFNLKVNPTKTEYTKLVRDEEESWKETKKVGSLIGDAQDINRRKQLSQAALNKLQRLWQRKKKLSVKTRLKLYNSLVKSILLYNSSTWGMNQTMKNGIDAFHRKQLRQILGIRYPHKISNKKLYKMCDEKPLSISILRLRWQLFGHVLRRDQQIPANKAMKFYFSKLPSRKFSGRKRTTLPITLHNDLQTLYFNDDDSINNNDKLKLQTLEDHENMKVLANQRDKFKNLISALVTAAEVLYDF